MFEVRKPPGLPYRILLSSDVPHQDVTPDQVREYVAAHPEAQAVTLSAAFLSRRGPDPADWRLLDQELEDAGVEVYFVLGGTASWEAHICLPQPASSPANPRQAPTWPGSRRPPEAQGVAGVVTPGVVAPTTGAPVLQPESDPEDVLDVVPTLVPDSGDVGGLTEPVLAVTPGHPGPTSGEPVLQHQAAAGAALEGIPVEARIGQLNAQGHGRISHMTVARKLKRRQALAQLALGLQEGL